MSATPTTPQEPTDLLRQLRTLLGRISSDRLAILIGLILGLGAWLGLVVTHLLLNQPIGLGGSYRTAQNVLPGLWALPLLVGLALAFYYWGRRRLVALDQEMRAISRDPIVARREFRTLEGLYGRFTEVQRARDQNVLFGFLAATAVLWVASPLLVSLQIAALLTIGVTGWGVVFFGPVVAVWLVLTFRLRTVVSRLEADVERLSSEWWRPSEGGESPGTEPPSVGPSPPAKDAGGLIRLPVRTDLLSKRAHQALIRETWGLWVIFWATSIGAVVVPLTGVAADVAYGWSAGWFPYLVIVEAVGILPALALVLTRTSYALRSARNLARSSSPEDGTAPSAVATAVLEVRRARSLLSATRRVLESSLVVALYGAAWITLWVPWIVTPAGALIPVQVALSLLVSLYLAIWFRRSHSLFLEESRAREWVDGLLTVELEFWTRY